MKAKVTSMVCPRADWIRVSDAARQTKGLEPKGREPIEIFKRKMLLSEHSPIRLLEYDFTIEGIRQWVTVHLVRHHVGCEKFVSTQRQDINDKVEQLTEKVVQLLKDADLLRDEWKERDYLFQGEENSMMMTCNAQAFINISRKRLCFGCASKETREVWQLVIDLLREIDPILAEKCVRECIYRGFCPEYDPREKFNRCCGYVDTEAYSHELIKYRQV